MLFPATTPHTVLDGELGSVRYFPNAAPPQEHAAWFAWLHANAPWGAFRRQMYEREVVVPRLVCGYELDDPELPPTLHAARAVCERVAGQAFTSVGMNLYRDGNDSVAPHNDRLDDLIPGAPIALLSLGDTRRLVLATKAAPKRRLALDLEPGSVLVMSYDTQLHLDHGVPKTRTPVGPRISLAFRARPPKDERRGVRRPRYVPLAQ